jgi:phosphatidylglycerophosphate synthase
MRNGDLMKKYLTFLPNAITLLRVPLTALFIGMLAVPMSQGVIRLPAGPYIVFGLICLSDLVDGAAARALNAKSGLGGILDVSVDSLYIFSSLILFNFFGVLPVCFTVVVFANFLVFLTTSRILIRFKPGVFRRLFVFDAAGRAAAAIFYLIPAAVCFVYSHPGAYSRLVLNIVLFAAALLAGAAVFKRCVSCFAALRADNCPIKKNSAGSKKK